MAKPALRKPKKKVCVFCKEKIASVDYKDTSLRDTSLSDHPAARGRVGIDVRIQNSHPSSY